MPLYICEIIFCRICNRYCYTILAIALWYLLVSLTNCLFGLFSLQIVQNLMFLLRCLKIFITDFSVWRGIVFPKCVACFKNFFLFLFHYNLDRDLNLKLFLERIHFIANVDLLRELCVWTQLKWCFVCIECICPSVQANFIFHSHQ